MLAEQRIMQLERENRWIKLGGTGIFLILLVGVFGGAGQRKEGPQVADEIRARRFVLMDEAGQVRGLIECDARNSRFSLAAAGSGAPRVVINATVASAIGKGRAELLIQGERDAKAYQAAQELVKEGTAPSHLVSKARKAAGAQLGLSTAFDGPDAMSALVVMDENGRCRISMVNTEKRGPRLTLFDRDGKSVLEAPD